MVLPGSFSEILTNYIWKYHEIKLVFPFTKASVGPSYLSSSTGKKVMTEEAKCILSDVTNVFRDLQKTLHALKKVNRMR